jgi:hypothetical protein
MAWGTLIEKPKPSGVSSRQPPIRLIAGQSPADLVSAHVAPRTQGALTAMIPSPAKVILSLVFLLGFLVASAGALVGAAWGEKAAPSVPGAADADKGAADEPTVLCVVRDKAGKPVAGARVYWTSATTVAPALTSIKALPRSQWTFIMKVLGEGKTDAEGRCELRGHFTGREVPDTMALAAVAPGYGLSGKTRFSLPRPGPAEQAPLTLTLRPEVKIQGQLMTPAGAPAKGVRVRLNSIRLDSGDGVTLDPLEGSFVKTRDSGAPPYWPTALTDTHGRFTLHKFSEDGDASLTLIHEDFELQNILVSSKPPGGDATRLKPEFTHTLAPGRTLRGVVTAADTGKPLPGVFLDIAANGPNGRFYGEALTDDQGRY